MTVRRPSLAWLPLIQLILVAALVAAGLQPWAAPDASDAQSIAQQHALPAHQPPVKPAPPPYTFPAGGRTLFPKYRLVALYGSPDAPVLGVLGQQNIADSITRVKKLAASYQPYSAQQILPTFEIITTVASSTPTSNHDYSREIPLATIQRWVSDARKQGVYVVLDLQSGRANSLTQAKQYESVLAQPNVGLALDPEWRIRGNQKLLVDIGELSAKEINQTSAWLSQLTRKHHLPQKLFVLHQFRLDMLPDRANIQTAYDNLAFVVQMDGQGTPSQKDDTWHSITKTPLPHSRFGWKNFYKKDTALLSPKQTMAIRPQPWYVSYQ